MGAVDGLYVGGDNDGMYVWIRDFFVVGVFVGVFVRMYVGRLGMYVRSKVGMIV